MKGLALYVVFILFITIIIPITLIKGCDVVSDEPEIKKIEGKMMISVYNIKKDAIEDMELEEYVKGVVAAEMPAEFHIEALKAQAVAARTYATYHMARFKQGKVKESHPKAPVCTGIDCQAWLSTEELRDLHKDNWMYEYWPKIEEAVEATEGEILVYNGQPIEPLFHSTSGGMTDDSEDVFASAVPYLRGVKSPYEEGAPRLHGSVKMSIDEFINKLENHFTNIRLTKSTLPTKIQPIEMSESGRIKKLRIDSEVVSGREIRSLFGLNSTKFKITILKDRENIQIDTVGYGHGVGMSQWGANGMAKTGSIYQEILKHYYTGVEIQNLE